MQIWWELLKFLCRLILIVNLVVWEISKACFWASLGALGVVIEGNITSPCPSSVEFPCRTSRLLWTESFCSDAPVLELTALESLKPDAQSNLSPFKLKMSKTLCKSTYSSHPILPLCTVVLTLPFCALTGLKVHTKLESFRICPQQFMKLRYFG